MVTSGTLFLLLLFLSTGIYGQFIFQNLRGQDGLSAKQVRCLYKDSDGFLWIGTTNGLNRFDGAVIKQYIQPKGEKSVYVNAIHQLEDQNKLMVGTGIGIKIFDKKTGLYYPDKRFLLLQNEAIVAIRADPAKRIWIVCLNRIFIFSNDKLLPVAEVIPAASVIQNTEFLFSSFVWDTLRYGFWIGGENSYFIDLKKNEVYHKRNNPFHAPLLNASLVKAIALDKDSNVWYGNDSDSTLNYWDFRKNKTETFYKLDGKKINGGCNHIFVDRKNRVWISTWLFASFLKEPGKPVKKVPYSQNQIYSIGYGFFRDVVEDEEGNIWFGTINGISKSQDNAPLRAIYRLPSFDFFLETGFSHANSIVIDGHVIVACKEEGVTFYNMITGNYKRYLVTIGPDLFQNKFQMAVKNKGNWWFAGEAGILTIAPGTNILKKLDFHPKVTRSHSANLVLADNSGRLWFHIRNDALYRYDVDTKKLDRFDGSDPAFGSFSYSGVLSFLELRNGNLVFALEDKGLLVFDTETEKFSEIRIKNSSGFQGRGMAEDARGDIWISVWSRGIFKINLKGDILDSVSTGNNLLYDYIRNVGIDNRGAVWAASREGLMFYTPETKAVTRVEIDLGQNIQDYWNNLEINKGKVYAVMLDHVVVFDPLLFTAIPVKKPPHITSVYAFQKEITNYGKSELLELAPEQDGITFNYASLYHRDIASLVYSYQLEGIDENWVNAGRTLVASYNNLPHGHYNFKVRSTDEYGKWMPAITQQRIYIRPFWWQTWWAICVYFLLLILLLVSLYKSLLLRRQKHVIDSTIDYFANSVYGENSVNEICWDIARNCISQLRFEDCVVYLWDKDKKVLVQKAAYGPKNPKGHEISNPMELELGHGVVGLVALTGIPLNIGDTTKEPRYVVDDERRMSELAVPILHEGKVIGVVDSEHHKKNFFTENHLKALSTIASISANKIAEAIAQAHAQEKEIKLLEINKMLAESQLMALRAQMNPHFVFNCLNSIQECIVTEKYTEASKYLNKFSKLFRMVLNNSGRNLVTIQEEMEVLELYLQLEQMRFEQSFSYKISIDEDLETEEILIPSMLLQPYAENALWHGLMHSPGKRKLQIDLRRISDDLMECRIDDNGIGRRKSFDLKKMNSKSKRHESKGLQISSDRLALLQRQGQRAQVSITDKYNEGNHSTGTLVTIELSTFLKNI